MEAFDRRDFVERSAKLALAAGAFGAFPDLSFAAGPTKRQLRGLQREIEGEVVPRGVRTYNRDRLVANTRFDHVHPDAIVYCETASDVEKTVRWARRSGVHIVPRCGGHSYGGYSTTSGVVVDVTRIDFVHPHKGGKARIGAGGLLIDVYSKLWNKRRVTIPAGSGPSVGIAGLALGGGIGFASRRLGTTADAVKEVTIVTARGQRLVCNAHEHEDLYWASRGGGGGNFGIVTSFVFETHAADRVSTFYMSWPWNDAAQVIDVWQGFAPQATNRLFAMCNLSAESGGTPKVSVSGQFFGSEAALQQLLQPLVNTGSPSTVSIRSRDYMQATKYWASCSGASVAECRVPYRTAFKAKSDYCLRPLSEEGRMALVQWVEQRSRFAAPGAIKVHLDPYGGAINDVPKAATAFVHRDALFSIQYFAVWPSRSRPNLQFINRFYEAMRPYVSGFAYVNYIDPALRNWSQAYFGSNYRRLTAVKRKYDPHNVFHFRQSIRRRP